VNPDSLLDAELRKRAAGLRKADAGVTLNEYPGVLAHHRKFGELLGIQETPWYQSREEQIISTGLAEAYKKAELTERILSTDDTVIPKKKVINHQNKTEESPVANGPGVPPPDTSSSPPV